MITVDCRNVEPIKQDLVVYVADQLGAIPAIQISKFVLSPLDDADTLDSEKAATAIREYLDSIGEASNFAILRKGDHIDIHSVNGKQLEPRPHAQPQMFSCPHCGFVTQYEVEYNTHKRIHYL